MASLAGLATKVSRAGAAHAIFTGGARVSAPKVIVPAFKMSSRGFAAAAEVSAAVQLRGVTGIYFLMSSDI